MARHLLCGIARILTALVLFLVSSTIVADVPSCEARSKIAKKSSKKKASRKKSKRRSTSSRSKRRHRSKKARHSKASSKRHKARAPKYAYPYDFFMMDAPAFDKSPLSAEQSQDMMRAFANGEAGDVPANMLVRGGVFKYHALKGGIFYRREPVKYIIMHSTETGNPNMDAVRVINSWSSRGRRHPGAQFVIDRDGTIWQCVDPDLGTVHINIFKTIPGVNNDNCIGIEMVHSGSQNYPPALVTSAVRLVNYLQERYNIEDENVTTHCYVQQGDHTDPVNFDWAGFIMQKNKLRTLALSRKMNKTRLASSQWRSTPMQIPGKKEVAGSIVDGDKEKDDVNLLELKKDENAPKTELEKKHPDVYKQIEEPKAPTTLLQLRGPIELTPEDALKLNADN